MAETDCQMIRTLFLPDVQAKICQSFKNGGLSDHGVARVFEWLTKPPKWTTIRVNKCHPESKTDQCLQTLQNFVDQSYQDWFEMLKKSQALENEVENSRPGDLQLTVPKCRLLNDLVEECLVFDCSNCLRGAQAEGPSQVNDARL